MEDLFMCQISPPSLILSKPNAVYVLRLELNVSVIIVYKRLELT